MAADSFGPVEQHRMFPQTILNGEIMPHWSRRQIVRAPGVMNVILPGADCGYAASSGTSLAE